MKPTTRERVRAAFESGTAVVTENPLHLSAAEIATEISHGFMLIQIDQLADGRKVYTVQRRSDGNQLDAVFPLSLKIIA